MNSRSDLPLKYTLISLVLWKWEGAVAIGGTSVEFSAWAKKFADVDVESGDNAAGHAHVSYGKPWVMWIESLKDVPSLAHEALHVTAGILEARGLKYTAESEEAYTYTMEYIIRQVLSCKKWKTV